MTAEDVLKCKLSVETMAMNSSDYTFNKVIEAMQAYAAQEAVENFKINL